GERFARRVFDHDERTDAGNAPTGRIAALAAIFGVKESVIKALGGLPAGSGYADVSVAGPVRPVGSGRPGGIGRAPASPVHLSGVLGRWAAASGGPGMEILAGVVPVRGDA